jgi:hypothetical protein
VAPKFPDGPALNRGDGLESLLEYIIIQPCLDSQFESKNKEEFHYMKGTSPNHATRWLNAREIFCCCPEKLGRNNMSIMLDCTPFPLPP